MSEGMTVVLGWDGLDFELVQEFGLAEAFGTNYKRIETIDNPELGKPHTTELWPTIITGLQPEEHGFRVSSGSGRAEWKNPTIDRMSRLAQGLVPKRIRTLIGAYLRETGEELSYTEPADYVDKDIETIFDGRTSFPIAIPNYRTVLDRQFDFEFNRRGGMNEYLNLVEENDEVRHEPQVPLPELELRLTRELHSKLGLVHAGLQREYDLIFAWLGYLDTVGHLAPVADPGWQERAYRLAAVETNEIRSLLTEADTLVCVSDHGLQKGRHTHQAFLGSGNEDVIENATSVVSVKNGLEQVTPSSGELEGYPPLRDAFQVEDQNGQREADEVRSQLEDLGYL